MGVIRVDVVFGVDDSLVDALQLSCAMSAVSQVELSAPSTGSTRWRATEAATNCYAFWKREGTK